MAKKKMLTITIFEDINELHEVNLLGNIYYTRSQTDLREVIGQVIQTRLDTQHEIMLEELKKQGALKH